MELNKELITKSFQGLLTSLKNHWGKLVYLLICIAVLFVLKQYVIFSPDENKVTNKFSKADFSSDKSWLGCRQHQHDCIYIALSKERSASSILDECGLEDECDQLFGGKNK